MQSPNNLAPRGIPIPVTYFFQLDPSPTFHPSNFTMFSLRGMDPLVRSELSGSSHVPVDLKLAIKILIHEPVGDIS